MLGPSDGELWATGGEDAFTQLFERHAEAVWNHAYRLTASWTLAEGLTSRPAQSPSSPGTPWAAPWPQNTLN